jgi:hypothetical protein
MSKTNDFKSDALDSACFLYSKLVATKEEAFLVGYLMSLGGELSQIKRLQDDVQLIETELEKWMPIIAVIEKAKEEIWITHLKQDLEMKLRLCEENIAQTKSKLRASFQARGASPPKWLEEDVAPSEQVM